MILTHKDQTSHESTKDLREDVVRDLLPRKALPVRKADGDSWVEVSSGCRCTCYDRKSDTNRVGLALGQLITLLRKG